MSPLVTRWPGPRSICRCRGTELRPCTGTRPAAAAAAAAAAGSAPRPTRSSARPMSQSRLGTTSPAGVKAIFRSSAWEPESLRQSPLAMSTASSGVAANSRPA